VACDTPWFLLWNSLPVLPGEAFTDRKTAVSRHLECAPNGVGNSASEKQYTPQERRPIEQSACTRGHQELRTSSRLLDAPMGRASVTEIMRATDCSPILVRGFIQPRPCSSTLCLQAPALSARKVNPAYRFHGRIVISWRYPLPHLQLFRRPSGIRVAAVKARSLTWSSFSLYLGPFENSS